MVRGMIPGVIVLSFFVGRIPGSGLIASVTTPPDSLQAKRTYEQVYRSALSDGTIDESERRLLEVLRSSLNLSQIQAETIHQQIRAQSPGVKDQSGRWPLVLQNIVWGGGLYGWGIPYVLDAQDPKWFVGMEMLSLGTAFYITYQYTKDMDISHGRAQMMRGGSLLGFRYGWGFNTLTDLWPFDQPENGQTEESHVWAIPLMVSVPAGIYLGDVLYKRWEPSHGQAWTLTLAGEMGGFTAQTLHSLVDEDPGRPDRYQYEDWSFPSYDFDAEGYNAALEKYKKWQRVNILLELAGYPAGIYLGHRWFGDANYTFGDALMLYQGRGVGWIYGALFTDLIGLDIDSRAGTLFRLAGSGAGIWGVNRFIGGKDYTFGESTLMLLGTGSGMAFGVGIGALLEVDDSKPMDLLFMGGGAGGFWLTNSILNVRPENSRGHSSMNRPEIIPRLGLRPVRNHSSGVSYRPNLGLDIRF